MGSFIAQVCLGAYLLIIGLIGLFEISVPKWLLPLLALVAGGIILFYALEGHRNRNV